MMEKNPFKIGDLVEPNAKAKETFRFRRDSAFPWKVVAISRDKRMLRLERTNSKNGKKWLQYWWFGWFRIFVDEDNGGKK